MDTLKKEQEMLKIAEEVKRQKINMMRGINTDLSSVTGINTESFVTENYKTPGYLNKVRKQSEMNTNLSEFNSSVNTSKLIESSHSELDERNKLRNAAKKQIQRQVHQEKNNYVGKNNDSSVNNQYSKNKSRDNDTTRDISELMALGKHSTTNTSNNDLLIDTRLYNNTSGLDTGFKFDDEYDLYDKPLFADRSQSHIFKKVGNIGGEDNTEKVLDSKRIMEKIKMRGKMFEGAKEAEPSRNRSNKIEFTREEL
jgi:SNW domain-containing protein 1